MESHSEAPRPTAAEAAAALDMVHEAHRTVAARAASPRGYYVLVGAALALLVGSLPVQNSLRWAFVAAALALAVGAISWYRRHTGVAAYATFRERGVWRVWALIGVLLVGGAAAALTGSYLVSIPAALVVWGVCAWLGPAWDADMVRSLEQDA